LGIDFIKPDLRTTRLREVQALFLGFLPLPWIWLLVAATIGRKEQVKALE
jgi:hypothetical protein